MILCVQVAVLHIGLGLIAPILPLYAQTFGVSLTLVGFLLTAQALPRIFVNLPTGRWADKWGAHRTMTVAAMIVTISAFIGGLAPNYFIFFLTRLLQGVGTGMSQTSGFTYAVTVSQPESRARYISLYQGSFLLGSGIGPVIGGFAAQYFGFQAPFFIYAILAASVGLWMFIRLPDPRRAGDPAQTGRKTRPGFLESMRRMLGHRGVMLASLIGFLAAYNRVGTRNMAIPLLGDVLGFSEGQIGAVLSILFIMTFVSLYFVGNVADRFGRKAVIVPSWLVVAAALVIVAFAPGYGIYVLGATVFGLASGIGGPVPAAYVADAADEESQGMAIGVFRTFSDFGLVVGPLVMGWMIDQSSVTVGLLVNAVTVIIVALAFWFLAPEPQAQNQPASV
ncbi:MAG: MFS transporter [Anaerolineae bacterium]|nr:MFS transporter [Anaerolineae bacterium]